LRVADASRVATYAYVNPVIAIVLGWSLAGEEFTVQMLIAAAVIILAVVLIITNQTKALRQPSASRLEGDLPTPKVKAELVEE
jgi:drug/metabolite transporter (DMT)-like permease